MRERAPANLSRYGGQGTPLARIIAQAGAGQRVRYRNGDTSDLRRENLHIG